MNSVSCKENRQKLYMKSTTCKENSKNLYICQGEEQKDKAQWRVG